MERKHYTYPGSCLDVEGKDKNINCEWEKKRADANIHWCALSYVYTTSGEVPNTIVRLEKNDNEVPLQAQANGRRT